VFNQVRPALAAMGEEVVLMGGPGSGQLAKMANNVLFNVSIAAMSEMLPLAVKFGLDPEKLAKSVSAGSGQSFGFDFFAPLALKRDFGPGYPLQAAWVS
jgi:3-hydroxyisobutyrate dehydrogenase-like beta-hydroxyacid dehydrogenase